MADRSRRVGGGGPYDDADTDGDVDVELEDGVYVCGRWPALGLGLGLGLGGPGEEESESACATLNGPGAAGRRRRRRSGCEPETARMMYGYLQLLPVGDDGLGGVSGAATGASTSALEIRKDGGA